MTSTKEYLESLQALHDWTPFLLKHSGLPGPRGNLELAQAVAELADSSRVEALLRTPRADAPENSPQVFLVFCGITALGKMAARGDHRLFQRLRTYAADERWRLREAVAIALQYVGDADMSALLAEMQEWSRGDCYEMRAAAAALAEPRLLKDAASAAAVLDIFDGITGRIASDELPRDEAFKVLRQGMAYCWSVAVAAAPSHGKPLMAKWLKSSDPDIRWIMKENLKKNRLVRMDAKWVETCKQRLEARS